MTPDADEARYIPGIAHPLPPGERVLWVGAPDAARLARHALHVRALAAYFLVLTTAPALFAPEGASPLAAVLAAGTWVLPLGLCTLVFLHTLAALVARTTVYAVTDRRVVMRIGVALPTTINLPLAAIDSVDVLTRADGGGELAITLGGDARLAYILLWPHARPWRLSRPRPTLRALPDVAAAAEALRTALAPTALAGQQDRGEREVSALALGAAR